MDQYFLLLFVIDVGFLCLQKLKLKYFVWASATSLTDVFSLPELCDLQNYIYVTETASDNSIWFYVQRMWVERKNINLWAKPKSYSLNLSSLFH